MKITRGASVIEINIYYFFATYNTPITISILYSTKVR